MFFFFKFFFHNFFWGGGGGGGRSPSHSRIFHSYYYVTITGEGLQILTHARHLWSLSSEGSLAFHSYCDTEHPFTIVISEDPWHSHLLPSVWQWGCHYLFYWLNSVAAGILTPNIPLVGRTPLQTAPPPWLPLHYCSNYKYKKSIWTTPFLLISSNISPVISIVAHMF